MKRQSIRKTILLLSFLAFPITLNYLSPYLIIRGSFEGVLCGSGVLFLSMLLMSLVLGRAFCGWLCPAGSLGEICATINNKPVKRGANIVKYLIWVPWLATIVFGFIHAGGLKQINLIYYTDGGISVNAPTGYYVYFTVIALIVALSFSLGRRGFCHSVCWAAPFMVLGNFIREKLHIPGLRLAAQKHKCIGCKTCNKACPMSLDVQSMVQKADMHCSECILCANCADVCSKKVLRLTVSSGKMRDKDQEEIKAAS